MNLIFTCGGTAGHINPAIAIANMMKEFTNMVVTGKRPVSWAETVHMNRVVLAGIASRERGGCAVRMHDFMSDAQKRAGAVQA